MLNSWAKKSDIEMHTFGIENKSDCNAINIKREENLTEFYAKLKDEEIALKVPVGGDVFILNSLCATLVGKIIGLSNEQIQKGISSFELTKKRMEIIKTKNEITLINDSYNASFDSMKAAIEYLSNTNSTRKIAVLGDMFELGEFSEELHRKVGVEVAKNHIDLLFTVGENSKYIAEEAENNGMKKENIFYYTDKQKLLEKIKNTMEKGDSILFKASNGMKLFDIVEKLK